MSTPSPRAILVCPLRHECHHLRRAGLGRLAQLECIGPGTSDMAGRIEAIVAKTGGPVILAGLAGGLNPSMPAGSAWVIDRVIGPGSEFFDPPVQSATTKHARIISVMDVLMTPQAKREIRMRSGADLVDLESAEFARVCTSRGWRWGIVRGVSDDADATLPEGIAASVDEVGGTRPWAVLRHLLLRPSDLPMMMRLSRDSRRAMSAVAEIIASMLAEH